LRLDSLQPPAAAISTADEISNGYISLNIKIIKNIKMQPFLPNEIKSSPAN